MAHRRRSLIARTWHGTTDSGHADAYVRHLREHTFPALAAIPGHCGGYVLRRPSGNSVEFTVITLWDSLNAIRHFAGEDLDAAVVPAAAAALLASYDTRAAHWEVALS
jgi:heme-degrading monooxygenase HmoA